MTLDEKQQFDFMKKILLAINHSAIVQSSSASRSYTILTGHALEGNINFSPDFLKELAYKDTYALDMLISSDVLSEDELSDALEFYASVPDENGFHADRLLTFLDHDSPLVRWSALSGLGFPHHYKQIKVQQALNDIVMKQQNGFFEEMAKSILEDASTHG